MPQFSRTAIALILPTCLAACAAVGPDYAGPPARPAGSERFVRAESDSAPVLEAAPWWKALGDAQLDTLIQRALTDSPDLQAASARVEQARASFMQQEAASEPKLAASGGGGVIEQAPGTGASNTRHGYTASLMASWELDLAGGTRRKVEAADASRQAVEADLADARLALTTEVAQAYVRLRQIQQQDGMLGAAREATRQALELTRQRRAQGVASEQEVEQRVDQLAASDASLEQLAADRLVALDRLALLCGLAPGSLDEELKTPAALPTLPEKLAVGDPTEMLRHRPDIRAAERRLAATNAQIGAQKANYFPKLSLYGGAGFFSTDSGQVFDQRNAALFLVPFLSWDFLDFNRTTSAVHKAEAGHAEALANYRSQVLRALNDANAALARFERQKQKLAQIELRRASAERQWELVRQRHAAGVANRIALADADRQLSDARQQELGARAELLNDYVLLQKSLGLGWQAS